MVIDDIFGSIAEAVLDVAGSVASEVLVEAADVAVDGVIEAAGSDESAKMQKTAQEISIQTQNIPISEE